MIHFGNNNKICDRMPIFPDTISTARNNTYDPNMDIAQGLFEGFEVPPPLKCFLKILFFDIAV